MQALDADATPASATRAAVLYKESRERIYRRTDRMFAWLMLGQWAAAIAAAFWLSPRSWSGPYSYTHVHIWAALLLGGAITLVPVAFAFLASGKTYTRHIVAVGQMLMSGLLIHLSGGRIETHFHVFGSLAFLAMYRDWPVLVSATIVVAIDDLVRGLYWPQSVFGVMAIQPWRWLEHAGWVAFEDFFLIISSVYSMRDVRRLAERQAHLESVSQGALAASSAKSEFLSSMSHEIRTPMNSVLGMADLLSESDLSEEQRHYLDVMIANGNSLLELINSILDLAKIESGNLQLETIEFDLGNLVEKILATFATRAHGKGLELAARIAPGTPEGLIGDPMRLRQVLINLIGNAVKFTEVGEVVLEIGPDPAAGGAGDLLFCVADTGVGIAEDKREAIFASFTQADSSDTRKYGGTGLGLAIAQRLVALMGGRIRVDSAVGKGSRFLFSARFGLAPRLISSTPRAALDLIGYRVLVVDDNAVNRLILHEMVGGCGAEITEAESGAAALAAIRLALEAGFPYHIVLLDMMMPEMDGLEVAMRIRAAKLATEPLVLMLSSNDLKSSLKSLHDAGLDAYLVKPVTRTELFAAIRRVIDSRGFQLPVAAPTPIDSTPQAERIYTVEKADPLVLVAEDSPDNRLLISAYLKREHFELEFARDGQEALEKFKQTRFDLVLMDIQMPRMDGIMATRLMRQWESENQVEPIPIIALTASVLAEDVNDTIAAGCSMHLNKPIKKQVLLNALRIYLPAGQDSSPELEQESHIYH
ncbi:MAG TPA: response regulator [Candidatus Binataceae bacterium]|nr:response regulator [Candidatus Binataceae bacterium]